MATFVSDSFTDTSGTALSSHTGETGATWTQHADYSTTLVISNANRVRTDGTATIKTYYASGTPAGADYTVSMTIRQFTGAGHIGLVGRVDTASNTMYRTRYDGGANAFHLQKIVAGTATLLGTFAHDMIDDEQRALSLVMDGDQISVNFDGVPVIEPPADTAISAAGLAGLYGFSTGSDTTGMHGDTFSATDIAAGGATVEPQDSTQGHTVAAPALTQVHSLTVVSSTQGHTATSPDVQPTAAGVTINIVSATNGHTVSAPDITVNSTLVIVGSTAGHTATSPALVQTHVVSIVSATHGHVTTPPTIGGTSLGTISIVSVTMGHTVSAPEVTTFSLGTTPAERTFTVANENRNLSIAAESRTLVA